MKAHNSFALVILLFSLFISCEFSTRPLQISDQSIPLDVGTWWQYAITDTLIDTYTGEQTVTHYTGTVRVVANTRLPDGKTARLVTIQYANQLDTLYVRFQDDTLLVYRVDDNTMVIQMGFIFPLKPGNTWQMGIADYRVEQQRVVTVPAGTLRDGYDVREYPRIGNLVGWNQYTLVPGVGLVQYHMAISITLSEINHRMLWQLTRYELSD